MSRHTTIIAALLLAGCTLATREAAEERARMEAARTVYDGAASERPAPELPPDPRWQDVLRHAFLANGELEAAYFAWRAAVERIDVAAGYPNTNVSVGFEYLFSGGNLTGWDRTSLSVGFDPMQNLSFPTKVMAAGRVATEEARAAGERFAAAKFALQRDVLTAWLDYALLAEQIRVQREMLELLRIGAQAAAASVLGGRPQEELLMADVEHGHGEHELLEMESALSAARARLNARIGRPADAPLPPPALPEPRPLPDDAALLAAGTRANPELAALARDVAARDEALDLARQQYFPDINPFAGINGSIEQVVGAAITLPTRIPQIQAGIREARANLRASEAMSRQGELDRDAAFVATLLALRSAERQRAVLEGHVTPSAEQAAAAAERAYATGRGDFAAWLATQRTLLELRFTVAETRIARERQVAELEMLAGIDAERLAGEPGGAPDERLATAAEVRR
jgi:outer membrane protein TolC